MKVELTLTTTIVLILQIFSLMLLFVFHLRGIEVPELLTNWTLLNTIPSAFLLYKDVKSINLKNKSHIIKEF